MSESIRQLINFGMIDPNVMRDPNLSPQVKCVYAALCCYANKHGSCYPTLERLADDLQVSKRSVSRWLEELLEHRIIEREQFFNKSTITHILDSPKKKLGKKQV